MSSFGNIQPLTLAQMKMDNGQPEFKHPLGFGVRPLLQPKRLADLNCTHQFSAKKDNHNSHRSSVSARKFTQKKSAGLSQNMSTSKKMAAQKKSNNSVFKRAINFNNITKNDSFLKPDVKGTSWKNVPPSNDSIENITVAEPTNTSQFNAPTKTKSILKNSPLFKKIGFCTKSPVSKRSIDKRKSVNKSKSFLKRQENFDYSGSSLNMSSDKENSEDVNKSLNEKVSALISSHRKEVNNLKSMNNVPKELKSLIQKNLKISEKVIQLSSKLVENNVKLMNMFADVLNTKNSVDDNVREVEKPSFSRSPLKSISLPNNEYDDDISFTTDSKEINLRKIALLNSELNGKYPIAYKSPKMKKSTMMYTSFKSSMGFLKTPRPNDTIDPSDFETPNAKSRAVTSNNVKMQLERLFDS